MCGGRRRTGRSDLLRSLSPDRALEKVESSRRATRSLSWWISFLSSAFPVFKSEISFSWRRFWASIFDIRSCNSDWVASAPNWWLMEYASWSNSTNLRRKPVVLKWFSSISYTTWSLEVTGKRRYWNVYVYELWLRLRKRVVHSVLTCPRTCQ